MAVADGIYHQTILARAKLLEPEEELRQLNWQEADLGSQRKRHPGKVQIALRLRKETTLTVKEIAARLHMDTPGSISFCLLAAMRNP